MCCNICFVLMRRCIFVQQIQRMKTVREKLLHRLISCGMSYDQSMAVMDQSIPVLNNLVDDYKITFDRPSGEYPEEIYNILYSHIKPVALQWIDANKPHAWFRQIFVEQ